MGLLSPIAFGFGGPQDWVVIAVVALLIFGPKKLPEVGRQLGQAMREFNKLKDDLTGAAHSIRDEVESVSQPVMKPYSVPHTVSSPTVEAATAHRVYDQDPVDLMAPVVSELPHAEQRAPVHDGGQLLTPPPASVTTAADGAHEKGH